ncbi:MAG: M50 family metallopeptidase [Oscillospiraceae bacterium]|jgi:regulator of sigma E protease|nr:M50 family metallopeptidase [Oscillospiraceae bacterium]
MIPLSISIGELWGKAWPLLVAVLYFGFLILAHEAGHFSAARAFRVQVNEFSLGMGPRLLKFKRRGGETLYSLKAIPFGGSVLMDEDEEAGGNPRAFNSQKPWKRFCILFAGAFVNLVCGVLIMGVLVGMSSTILTTKVRGFVSEEASTLAQGLRAGDVITKVSGRRIYSFMDLEYLASRAGGRVDLTVRRDGKQVKMPGFQFPMEEAEGMQRIQFDFLPVYYSSNPEYKNAAGPPTFGLRVRETLQESVSAVRMVWLSLLDMVTGKFRLRDISGPIGVVNMLTDTAQEAQQGAASQDKAAARGALLTLLNLFALISINIGVMNLLPLPALDGGRLAFTGIEMIFRKPVPKKFEGYVHAAGFALLMVFMVVVSFSDIWALVKK